jgi:uncharacterized protein (UPF0276 family)
VGVTLVGAGYRPELRSIFTGGKPKPACAELIANRYFASSGVTRGWELEDLADTPVIIHGLSGNVASAVGPERSYLQNIRKLADLTGAISYSDHLAFTASRDRSLGHLAPNLFDDELLDQACRPIELMTEVTERRICLENLATKTTIAGSTYTPEEFYLALLRASDRWDCLLDLTNIWINGQNRPVDPIAFIEAIPTERIRYVHLAGGRWMQGELVDSHSEAVHPEVFDLLALLLETAAPQAVIIERDSNWTGAIEEVRSDLTLASKVVTMGQRGIGRPPVATHQASA